MFGLPRKKNFSERGQALIVVLLVMAVALTVVLSASSTSVTDIKTSSYEEESVRAFSAAEAGVEQYLLTGDTSGGAEKDVDTTTGATTTYTTDKGYVDPKDSYEFDRGLEAGETAAFWLVSHDISNLNKFTCSSAQCVAHNNLKFEVCFGDASGSAPSPVPAVEVSIYYDVNAGTAQSVVENNKYKGVEMKSASYDVDSGRAGLYNFTDVSGEATTNCSSYRYTIGTKDFDSAPFEILCEDTAGCLLMIKVKMLYATETQPVFIRFAPSGAVDMPAQGAVISSTGKSNELTRRVDVIESFPAAPDAFDNALYVKQQCKK